MADLLKQRLIGALLVLSIIIFIAVYLVNNATDNDPSAASTIKQPEFTTSVESLPVETADVVEEALVDPHDLQQKVTTAVVESAPIQEITSTVKATVNETVATIEKKADEKVQVVLVEKRKAIEKVTEPTKPVAKVEPKQVEKVEAKVNKEQWLIQLASFSQKPNALALQAKVKQLGLTANIEHVGSVYRVQVGPESNRDSAEKLAAKLASELKLKPQILTLKPNNNG